jgi:RNA polymerase sigma-70 factor (ECF subfamily)
MHGGGLEQLSDGELLAIVQGDDTAAAEAGRAFEVLYFRHRDFVFRVARRYSGNDEAAMDAAQEVFVYLLKKLPRLRLVGKLSTYLYPIAKNAGVDSRRRTEGERRRVLRKGVEGRAEADERGSGGADESGVARALEGLPEAQWEVLLMRVVDGMSVAEVAAALGVPEGTVKSRLFHAIGAMRVREELRRMWGDGV